MVNVNPDKHIRKAVSDVTNNLVVSGKTIKCFDSRVTGNANLNEYVLMTAQSKDVVKNTKCEYEWEASLLIEIYTKTTSAGNSGSRLLLNDIEQAVSDALNPKLTIAPEPSMVNEKLANSSPAGASKAKEVKIPEP